ncbi:MAG: 2-C-methyl-D-erythritol 4-phosphate cytidylyltransferase [Lachnospiraceae bacterium]|nr:2-C-methyl-D-erythritol 4-phosphate cytidylyltransferase [Lachnospiraceae bacterium]
MKHVAVVVAAGKGIRMGSSRPKQYLELCGKPLLYYSLKVFEESFMDGVILVCGQGEEDFCRHEIVEKYSLSKVTRIVSGGKERFHSVYNGLMACGDCDYVYIHDGARPLLTQYILERCRHYVEKHGACVVASPASDTVKIEDGDGFIESTPDRSLVWLMQTPQVFQYQLIRHAYERLIQEQDRLKAAGVHVTDDTMVAKMYQNADAKLVENPDINLKVTTPTDLIIAEALMRQREKD